MQADSSNLLPTLPEFHVPTFYTRSIHDRSCAKAYDLFIIQLPVTRVFKYQVGKNVNGCAYVQEYARDTGLASFDLSCEVFQGTVKLPGVSWGNGFIMEEN